MFSEPVHEQASFVSWTPTGNPTKFPVPALKSKPLALVG
jgi:hypothetical protein